MSVRPHEQPLAVNQLLAGLPVHERNAVHRGSESRLYTGGEMLLNATHPCDYVFFPIDAVVSVMRPVPHGRSLEIGLVGSEGIVGLDAFFEAKTQLNDAVVQSGGEIHRMPAHELQRQVNRAGALQKSLMRFASEFMEQISRNAVCSRDHSLTSRLARWLLMVDDRAPNRQVSDSPSIAAALGENADEIAAALDELAARRTIRQRRHAIAILDRERLVTHACDCYDTA